MADERKIKTTITLDALVSDAKAKLESIVVIMDKLNTKSKESVQVTKEQNVHWEKATNATKQLAESHRKLAAESDISVSGRRGLGAASYISKAVTGGVGGVTEAAFAGIGAMFGATALGAGVGVVIGEIVGKLVSAMSNLVKSYETVSTEKLKLAEATGLLTQGATKTKESMDDLQASLMEQTKTGLSIEEAGKLQLVAIRKGGSGMLTPEAVAIVAKAGAMQMMTGIQAATLVPLISTASRFGQAFTMERINELAIRGGMGGARREEFAEGLSSVLDRSTFFGKDSGKFLEKMATSISKLGDLGEAFKGERGQQYAGTMINAMQNLATQGPTSPATAMAYMILRSDPKHRNKSYGEIQKWLADPSNFEEFERIEVSGTKSFPEYMRAKFLTGLGLNIGTAYQRLEKPITEMGRYKIGGLTPEELAESKQPWSTSKSKDDLYRASHFAVAGLEGAQDAINTLSKSVNIFPTYLKELLHADFVNLGGELEELANIMRIGTLAITNALNKDLRALNSSPLPPSVLRNQKQAQGGSIHFSSLGH